MEYVYHGSNISNLKVIKRHKSTHKQNWVYATKSEAISTIFLSKKGNDLYYYLGNDKDKVILVERKKNMFKNIFNTSGSIYKLSGKNFKENMTGWSEEVISNYDENVINEKYIENVYDELIKLDKEKKIKLYLYPDRPSNIPLDNSDLIPKVIKWKQLGFNIDNFFILYPELNDRFYQELNKL